ncbi:Glucan endo-1,3-beta-glucosidase 12 [Acorus calamus]|uniref:Glucan endo-1,3-beta-glucosidase 12 n=1 Tax=Acorus calamus TaxID=4465 RepID=A0AAV9E335_ACOCL|nr:Glucan endo-1,3-beta-glucosidase 12 [Acorus calamus]
MASHGSVVFAMITLLCIFINFKSSYAEWCVANPHAKVSDLQESIDSTCGHRYVDCSAIQPNGPCYEPNTVVDHASYVFNLEWQEHKKEGVICDFGLAFRVEVDPSHGNCKFPSDP